jgi:hypothetical protein
VCVSTIVLHNTMSPVFAPTAYKLASQVHRARRTTIRFTIMLQMVVMRQCDTKLCDMNFRTRNLEAGDKLRQHEYTLCVRVRACIGLRRTSVEKSNNKFHASATHGWHATT